MTDQSNEAEERAYERGERAVARSILTHLRPYLSDAENSELSKDTMIHDTRAALSSLARDMGCDDYPTDLHPADIVEKYIGRRIRSMFIRKWYPVRENLPPANGTRFLASQGDHPDKNIYIVHWDGERWRTEDDSPINFTHWMPLADPPEKDPQ